MRDTETLWHQIAQQSLRVRLAIVAVLVIGAVEAMDELTFFRGRLRRLGFAWWADLERRQGRRTHLAEIGYVARWLHPR